MTVGSWSSAGTRLQCRRHESTSQRRATVGKAGSRPPTRAARLQYQRGEVKSSRPRKVWNRLRRGHKNGSMRTCAIDAAGPDSAAESDTRERCSARRGVRRRTNSCGGVAARERKRLVGGQTAGLVEQRVLKRCSGPTGARVTRVQLQGGGLRRCAVAQACRPRRESIPRRLEAPVPAIPLVDCRT